MLERKQLSPDKPTISAREAFKFPIIQIQKRISPFMQKLWQFNIIARKEIGDTFVDADEYFEEMDKKFGQLADFLGDVKQRISVTQIG